MPYCDPNSRNGGWSFPGTGSTCVVLAAILLGSSGGPNGRLSAAPPALPQAAPDRVGMDGGQLKHIDRVVQEGLEAGQMAGCVVAIGRRGKLVWLKAYGHRQLEPEPLPMETDTLFDLASLTKPIATATSIMLLVERGAIRLRDPVASHIPEFAYAGKAQVTVEHLLTHQGGLIADNALKDYDDGPAQAFLRIFQLPPKSDPGTKFVYSDVGFLVLGELVRRKTGQDVAEFAAAEIFRPLGLQDTGFRPPEPLRQRAAATEKRDGEWIVGEVHDPRAHRLGGVAGHAGLFSTAGDLAVYAQMLLEGGRYDGVRVLGRQTVATMTADYKVSGGRRGLGWDKQTGYSSNRGELFSPRAFGHGGFTGTSLWVDPGLDLLVIFLANRLHPDGQGTVNPLAGRIGSIAAAAIQPDRVDEPPPQAAGRQSASNHRAGRTLAGIDVLERDGFRMLRGRRIGLITNHTGINRAGQSTARLLQQAAELELVALFSPEHGLEGKLDAPRIADTRDGQTGLPVYSLYGESRRPTAESLQGIDTLVFDIQDIGTRFYTYVSTMGNAMQAAAEHDLRFVVLDRPNPINGVDVAGPVLDAGKESFVGFHRVPVRHAMTVGELAEMIHQERAIGCRLEIVPLENWQRGDFFDATGLLWVNPSPNMRNLNAALLYPGIGLLETTNLSVGRGTDTPFELIGAPWMKPARVAARLNAAALPGVRFVPRFFTPDASKFRGQRCGGVQILITDRNAFRPLRTGFEVARALRETHRDDWQLAGYRRLLGHDATFQGLEQGREFGQLEQLYADELQDFLARRARYLKY